jgi:hypothetical protein
MMIDRLHSVDVFGSAKAVAKATMFLGALMLILILPVRP